MVGSWQHCPIIVLGTLNEWLFIIDGEGRFHALEPGQLTPKRVLQLCAPREEWLAETFPPRDGRHDFDCQSVREHLYSAAFERGLIDPQYFGFDVAKRGRRFVWGHRNGVLR